MSVYRTLIAIAAAMGLASTVFAADEATTMTGATGTTTEQTATTTTTDAAATDQKLDINKATVKELTKVNGINGAKARAIVNYRKKHGDFKTLDDLKQVKGFQKVSEDSFKEIQNRLTVG